MDKLERCLPAEPTTAPPGTPEKERVFLERLANREQLFHPADARFQGDTLPLEWLKWRENMLREQSVKLLSLIKSKRNGSIKPHES